MNKATMAVIAVAIATLLTIILSLSFLFYENSSRAESPCPLPDYESYIGHTQDLLILRGNCVVPTAIAAIKNKDLPKRPFVIGFLGNGEFEDAVKSLKSIVEDETDPDRGPAMIAIFRIDDEEGRQLAKKYSEKGGELERICYDILSNAEYLHRRTTYLQALRRDVAVRYGF